MLFHSSSKKVSKHKKQKKGPICNSLKTPPDCQTQDHSKKKTKNTIFSEEMKISLSSVKKWKFPYFSEEIKISTEKMKICHFYSTKFQVLKYFQH